MTTNANGLTAGNSQPVQKTYKQGHHCTARQQKNVQVHHQHGAILVAGFDSPTVKAQQAGRRFSVSGFSFVRKLRAARIPLYGGPCGTPQGVPVPLPGLSTCTVCHQRW